MRLPPLIQALFDPLAYPERPQKVDLCQTHISYVFLTDEFAYKIKKPVDFGFLDFTTLEKRLRYCLEEVRLNRRLAPEVYLGVVGIKMQGGRAEVGGMEGALEYAVKMRRIPSEGLLLDMLHDGRADNKLLERIAQKIAEFHKNADTGKRISEFGRADAIRVNTNENFSQTLPYLDSAILSRPLYDRIKTYTEDFLSKNEGLFIKRVESGFIRDCHGDMHCEHIAIDRGIEIIDCIEFNERFRFSDVVADTAFLSMDLDFHNRHDLTEALEGAYFRAASDSEGRALTDFYKCYRAYVRGKVEAFKSNEAEVPEAERLDSALSAAMHFYLAGLYASGGFRPAMILVRGLSGTGKSRLCEALSEKFDLARLSTDRIRKELAGLREYEHRGYGYKEGIYTDEMSARTYAALIERGAALLKEGRSVLLDGTFSKSGYIEEARRASDAAGAAFHAIECVAPEEKIRQNLEKRKKELATGGVVSDADWEIYLRQKKTFEPYSGAHLKIDTSGEWRDVLLKAAGEVFSMVR